MLHQHAYLTICFGGDSTIGFSSLLRSLIHVLIKMELTRGSDMSRWSAMSQFRQCLKSSSDSFLHCPHFWGDHLDISLQFFHISGICKLSSLKMQNKN